MFQNVIVRKPARSLVEGITSAPELGRPDYDLAVKQHQAYREALAACGVKVRVLEPLEAYPDSCFVEDTAVLTRHCAIVSNPGAASRNGEAREMLPTLREFFPPERIESIQTPGTLEGGDVMMVGDHFYVGRSARTNEEGIRQFLAILNRYGLTGSEFRRFRKIVVPPEEAYGANCIWGNDRVLVPLGYPTVEREVRKAGYEVLLTDTSEYRKLDGGLSCLSLRF